MAALQSFTLIYQATNGGPGYATMVPGLLVYRDAFQLGAVGSASALGIAMSVHHLRPDVRHPGPDRAEGDMRAGRTS